MIKTSNCAFERQLAQVAHKDSCFSIRGSYITTEDYVSEGTEESPAVKGSSRHSFNESFKRATNPGYAHSQEYCTCMIYKNCSGIDEVSRARLTPNELSMELNKRMSCPTSMKDEINSIDADFLFPKATKAALTARKHRKSHEIDDQTDRKVFNV